MARKSVEIQCREAAILELRLMAETAISRRVQEAAIRLGHIAALWQVGHCGHTGSASSSFSI
jgi:hypothetical protein